MDKSFRFICLSLICSLMLFLVILSDLNLPRELMWSSSAFAQSTSMSEASEDEQEKEPRVRLIGTVVGDEDSSWAIIEDLATNDQRLVRLNEIVTGSARLIRIERNRVVLQWGSRQETLEVGRGSKAKSSDLNVDLKRLKNSDPRIRQSAAFSLGEQGDARAVKPLLKALDDSDSGVREAAAAMLGMLKAQEAISELEMAVEDPDARVRWAAAGALKRIRD